MSAPSDDFRAPGGGGSGTASRVVAALWTVALVPAGLVLATITTFGISPTECYPPAPTFCEHPLLARGTGFAVAGGWVVSIGLALVSLSAWARDRAAGFLALSFLALVLTVLAMGMAIAAWGM